MPRVMEGTEGIRASLHFRKVTPGDQLDWEKLLAGGAGAVFTLPRKPWQGDLQRGTDGRIRSSLGWPGLETSCVNGECWGEDAHLKILGG